MGTMTADDFAAWRKRLGKTQAKVAEALGMSRRQVQHYESGSQDVPQVVFLATYTLEHLWEKFQALEREAVRRRYTGLAAPGTRGRG